MSKANGTKRRITALKREERKRSRVALGRELANGRQPHPDVCSDCQTPCYAIGVHAYDVDRVVRNDWLLATYKCRCGNEWVCGWDFSTLIDDPDPTPNPDAFIPPRRVWMDMRGEYVPRETPLPVFSGQAYYARSTNNIKKGKDMRAFFKVYYSNDKGGISTNITDEKELFRHASAALTDVASNVTSGYTYAFEMYLPLIVDLCCKLRGYKAPLVDEERVFFAGGIQPPESALVATGDDYLPLPRADVNEQLVDPIA